MPWLKVHVSFPLMLVQNDKCTPSKNVYTMILTQCCFFVVTLSLLLVFHLKLHMFCRLNFCCFFLLFAFQDSCQTICISEKQTI